MENALVLENICKSFKGNNILKDIDITIKKGEIRGLVGPNGAGKSTLLRIIVGLIKKDSGVIYINGINSKDYFEETIKYIGCMIEQPDLYENLTGYNNLRYYASLFPNTTKEDIDFVLKKVGLYEQKNKKYRNYSLGMKQRLGIAQALLHNPNILILDEPTNGLDPVGIVELRQILKDLSVEEGITILISSHLLSEIDMICDNITFLKNGKVVRDINKLKHNERKFIKIITNNNKIAITRLKEKLKSNIVLEGNFIKIDTTYKEIPTIFDILVSNFLDIYHISEEHESLEKTFMDLIGGEK